MTLATGERRGRRESIAALAFIADAYRDDVEIEGGCLANECAKLYYGPDAELPQEEQANL